MPRLLSCSGLFLVSSHLGFLLVFLCLILVLLCLIMVLLCLILVLLCLIMVLLCLILVLLCLIMVLLCLILVLLCLILVLLCLILVLLCLIMVLLCTIMSLAMSHLSDAYPSEYRWGSTISAWLDGCKIVKLSLPTYIKILSRYWYSKNRPFWDTVTMQFFPSIIWFGIISAGLTWCH